MKTMYADPEINPVRCTGCAMCVAVCPHRVLAVKKCEGYPCAVAVSPAQCTGCGICAAVCMKSAIEVENFRLTPAPIY